MGVRFEKFVSAVGRANSSVGRGEGLEETGSSEAKGVKEGRLIPVRPPFSIELSSVAVTCPGRHELPVGQNLPSVPSATSSSSSGRPKP